MRRAWPDANRKRKESAAAVAREKRQFFKIREPARHYRIGRRRSTEYTAEADALLHRANPCSNNLQQRLHNGRPGGRFDWDVAMFITLIELAAPAAPPSRPRRLGGPAGLARASRYSWANKWPGPFRRYIMRGRHVRASWCPPAERCRALSSAAEGCRGLPSALQPLPRQIGPPAPPAPQRRSYPEELMNVATYVSTLPRPECTARCAGRLALAATQPLKPT